MTPEQDRLLRDLHAALLSPDATDPGLVHRFKNNVEPKVRAIDKALLSTQPDDPGLVHVLKNETVKLVFRIAKQMGLTGK